MNSPAFLERVRKATDVDEFLKLDREFAASLAPDHMPGNTPSMCLVEPPAVEFERVDFEIFNDGRVKIDGGMLYASAPRLVWDIWTRTDRSYRVVVGLNGLVIRAGDQLIVVNPGAGNLDDVYQNSVISHKGMNRIRQTIRLLESRIGNNSFSRVTDVVLTDLRFVSCGAVAVLDREGLAKPRFPKAQVTAPSDGLEFARSGGRPRMSYGPPELPHLEFITPSSGEPVRVAPAVHRVPVPACGPGAAIVVINTPAQRVVYMGQLALTPEHLLYEITTTWDCDPVGVLEARARAMEWLVDGWLVIFQHGRHQQSGYLVKRHGTIRFDSIENDETA